MGSEKLLEIYKDRYPNGDFKGFYEYAKLRIEKTCPGDIGQPECQPSCQRCWKEAALGNTASVWLRTIYGMRNLNICDIIGVKKGTTSLDTCEVTYFANGGICAAVVVGSAEKVIEELEKSGWKELEYFSKVARYIVKCAIDGIQIVFDADDVIELLLTL